MKTILYCGHGWAENIGNAFIDMGINYSLKNALPDYKIYNISNTSNYIKWRYSRRKPFSFFADKKSTAYNFDIRTFFEFDNIVFGGSLLNINWLKTNHILIDFLISSQKKVIILGGGGGNVYSPEQFEFVKNILSKLNLFALISRDYKTFDTFKNFATHFYNGIDNALFLNNCFEPITVNQKFIASTFDFIEEPKNLYSNNSQIIKLNHSYSQFGRIEKFIKLPFKLTKTTSSRHIISDYPDDYLHIYANATQTYSDRVHACIATLIFGGQAQYFDNSDRSHLFERIRLKNIKDKLVSIDTDFIENEKHKQLEFLSSIL